MIFGCFLSLSYDKEIYGFEGERALRVLWSGYLKTNSKLYKNIRENIPTRNGNSIPNLQQYPDNDSILSKYFVQL